MAQGDRRTFLKQSAAGVAAVSTIPSWSSEAQAAGGTADSPPLPPQQATMLPGLHAYAEKSIAAGETINFRVSSSEPYHLDVCRLAGPVDDRASDVVLGGFDAAAPKQQPTHFGSYVQIEKSLPSDKPIEAISFECWIRPWRIGKRQGLMTQFDDTTGAGIGLFFGADEHAEFYVGDGKKIDERRRVTHAGKRLGHRRWYHVVGTWDGKQATVYVNGVSGRSKKIDGEVFAGKAPLRLAALGEEGLAAGLYDGDLSMPVIYSKALTAAEVMARYKERGWRPPEKMDDVIGCWPLREENGADLADLSEAKRPGRIINHATWMIGGPSHHAEGIPRYGMAYDPTKDLGRGHGLRFSSSDLVDCHWNVTHSFKIPKDAKSGVYVGRFSYMWRGKAMGYDATFIVRRPDDKPKAPILMICSTSTWLAYNCSAFAKPRKVGLDWNAGSVKGSHSPCCYYNHSHGQPTFYLGLNRPWPGAGADNLFSPKEVSYSHLMRGELFTHRWLDGVYGSKAVYEYDVIADFDLHRAPEMLEGYKTVIVNGHSEYWSSEQFTGLDRYMKNGGTSIVMSGNSFFWRTSFSEDGSVMECRKYDPRIGGRGAAPIGEIWHSHDKRRGSLMRECGFPEYETVGLACIGWDGLTKKEDFGIFHTVTPEHFMFNAPEKVGLKKDDTFGHAEDGGLPHAVGHEWDVRLSTLKDVTSHIPQGARLPQDEPPGIVTLANGYRDAGGGTFDYFTAPAPTTDGISAQLIYWDRPQGGRILHYGAIAIGWALSADPKLSALTRNALHHFGVPKKQG